MCSNYFPTLSHGRLTLFGVDPGSDLSTAPRVWKGYPAPVVLSDGGGRRLAAAEFGLLPSWSKERRIRFSTFNARSETVATAASFRTPWAKGQRCVIPADSVVEPDWRSGKSVATAIARADGAPMGIAGLWDEWTDSSTGEIVLSFTMLTVNADNHPLMRNFHKPNDEKRMVVILPDERHGDWLGVPPKEAWEMVNACPADFLSASPLGGHGTGTPSLFHAS